MTAPRKQLGYANVESKERFPHSHSLYGCGILQRQTKTDVYTKDWTLPRRATLSARPKIPQTAGGDADRCFIFASWGISTC